MMKNAADALKKLIPVSVPIVSQFADF